MNAIKIGLGAAGLAAGFGGTYVGLRVAGIRPTLKQTAIVWGVGAVVTFGATFALGLAFTALPSTPAAPAGGA